jgi:toxin ParE1/3/4
VKRLVYRPEATADVRAAFEWYEQQRDGLGGEFLVELAKAERALQTSPLAFRILRRDARRIMLRRFPYQLFYRVMTDVVVVVACVHGRRSPKRLGRRR